MEFLYSNRAKRDYKKFSNELRGNINSKLKLLSENVNHPSLRTKKIQGHKNDFESSINIDIRIVWQYVEGKIYVKAIGSHDAIF
jgi:mRNA-degrading endonuclease YafQ of YafQ-DinJ toxin-antitoxin module